MVKINSGAATSRPSGIYYSKANLDRAVSEAVALERIRTAQVFSNHASYGRERTSASLLSDPRGLSADDITARLRTLPTDREAELSRIAPNPRTTAS